MKRIIFLTIVLSIAIICVVSAHVFASSNTIKERKEIIIKYSNETELVNRKAISSVNQKEKPQRLERKKLIDTWDAKLEIVTIGENDDIRTVQLIF